MGDYAGAIQHFRQALAYYDEARSAHHASFCRVWLGIALRLQGDYRQAEQVSREVLATFKAMNDPIYSGYCLLNLGCLAFDQGDLTRAEQLQREALDMWQQSGQAARVADASRCLSHLMVASGEHRHAEARPYFQQALELSTKHQMAPVALDVCVGVAPLLASAGKIEQAIEFLTLAKQHQASTFETRKKARQLLNELMSQLQPEMARAAQIRGQSVEVWASTRVLLAELAEDHA